MLIERSVWAVIVVVLEVGRQDVFEVASADDQEPVEVFAAQGDADEALCGRVRLRCPRRRAEDPDVLALEDLVERGRELRVAVADQELGLAWRAAR